MAEHLEKRLNQQRDFLVGPQGAEALLVWYVDYTFEHSRRIRNILHSAISCLGEKNAIAAIRQAPAAEPSDQRDLAARSAVAAGWQDRYLDMHRALITHDGDYDETTVRKLAKSVGLDMQRFDKDFKSDRTWNRIVEDRESAVRSGLSERGGLFIDGRLYTGVWDESSLVEALEKPLGFRLKIAGSDFFRWATSTGLVLLVATIAALLYVNLGFHNAYVELRDTLLGLSFGEHVFALSLGVWINDGLMAIFFLIVGIEIKHELVDGQLSDVSNAALPLFGALGGMLVPALIYAAINYGESGARGWGVPMATDIAFTLGILAVLGKRVPMALKIFLSALAIADDLGAILVIAIFYGDTFNPQALLWAALVFAAMMILNRGLVYSRVLYLFFGVVLWVLIYKAGLHATLAGVLTAAAIPSRRSGNVAGVAAQTSAVFTAELQHTKDTSKPLRAKSLRSIQQAVDRLREPGFHLQHALEGWTNFLVLPLFAFFSTGVLIIGSHFDILAPAALGVIAGLVVGKPLGIVLFCWLAIKFGLAKLSPDISWPQLLGAGCLAGVGFTMSIFIASAAFQGPQLESVKLAILAASSIAAVIGTLILYLQARPDTNT